jgi:hypothetical protein
MSLLMLTLVGLDERLEFEGVWVVDVLFQRAQVEVDLVAGFDEALEMNRLSNGVDLHVLL